MRGHDGAAATSTAHEHPHDRPIELYVAIAAGVAYFAALVAQLALHAPMPVWLSLYLATYLLGGFFTVKEAWASVRKGRFEVDFLMVVAAIGAACVGRFGEGAVLLFLFSLGHGLEEYALARASRSITSLGDLAPRTAWVRIGPGRTEQRDVAELNVGDHVVVLPHSRIPADGEVVLGSSMVDQSAITGESMPALKRARAASTADARGPLGATDQSRVFAGSLNGAGALEVAVSAPASDSTLARVVQLVHDADQAASPTQRFIDRFQRIYVPTVIVGIIAAFAIGLLALGEPASESFYRSMVLLVAASPCALAIATPSAVLAAVARAARAGVLVKGGAPLEALGKVDTVAFDKTGTLTWGRPALTDIVPASECIPGGSQEASGQERAELIAVALAVEELSEHPVAGAISQGLAALLPAPERLEASDMRAMAGLGVRANVAGRDVRAGSLRMMDDAGVPVPATLRERAEQLQHDGRTIVIVAADRTCLGLIGVMDVPRQESRPTLAALRGHGVTDIVLLSGDNQHVADAVARAVGVDRCEGELLPEDKVDAIGELVRSGRGVCMVGDGVNDAPAMAGASVGIAMGAAGSAIALDSADIALMSDDLGRLPFLRRLSQATSALIRQNLIIALGIVVVLVAASLAGVAIGPVVLVHEGSTLLIVLNALRLLRFDHGREHAGIVHEERPQRPAPGALA